MRIKAAIKTDHQSHPGPTHGGEAVFHPCHRQIDRLFAKNRLPGIGGGLDEVGMGRRGRRDQHRLGGESGIEADDRRPARLRKTASRGRIRIGDAHQPRALMGGNIAGMNLADPASANDGDVEHGAFLRDGGS